MRYFLMLFMALSLFLYSCSVTTDNAENEAENKQTSTITFQEDTASQKVDVLFEGKPFTTYLYLADIRKPVLFPIYAANGVSLTRGYPLEPKAGEQVDHLHHIGHWMTHGVVNQVDFWASTHESVSTDQKMFGSVVHREITELQEGSQAKLSYVADWISDGGDTLIVEETQFIFSGDDHSRTIDRISKLTAVKDTVVFEDTKEGMTAIRVARFMEQPYTEAQELWGDDGTAMEDKIVDTSNVNGLYINSEVMQGDDVWGKRARWVTLSSDQDSTAYSITIMDHSSNVNYPTHWMARGYGLFAANALGSAAYTEGKEHLNFTLAEGESTTFRYRMYFHQGKKMSQETLDSLYDNFENTY